MHKEPAQDRECGEDGREGHESQDEGKGWLHNRQQSPKMPQGIQSTNTAFGNHGLNTIAQNTSYWPLTVFIMQLEKRQKKKIFFSKSERISFWRGTPIPLLIAILTLA